MTLLGGFGGARCMGSLRGEVWLIAAWSAACITYNVRFEKPSGPTVGLPDSADVIRRCVMPVTGSSAFSRMERSKEVTASSF